MKWKHDDGYDDIWVIPREVEDLISLGIRALKKYLGEPEGTTIRLSTKEGIMSDYQLNAGDSVVVTIADTNTTTGAAVATDPGSVTAVLSNATDTVVVDPSGTFLTLTAGATPVVGATVTVEATVGGVASTPAVGTYDVVADVTALSLSFGTETPPAAPAAPASGPAVGTAAGEINPVTGQMNT